MAEKKGAKADPGEIMKPAEIKAILAQARRGNPASCAIALTKEKDSVILLDKRKKPKAVLGDLKKAASSAGIVLDGTTLRFGRATVDAEVDSSLLVLMVNKEAPASMRLGLLEQLKKAGFGKLEIIVSVELEAEAEDESPSPSPAAPPGQGDAQATPTEPVAETTAAASASDAATPPSPEPPPGTGTAPTDAATTDSEAGDQAAAAKVEQALTRTLTDLVRRMLPVIAQNPGQKTTLMQLANDAQASLKRGDLDDVAALVEKLRDAIAGATASGDGAGAAPEAGDATTPNGIDAELVRTLEKAHGVWDATLGKVNRDLDQLVKAVLAAAGDHELGETFESEFQTVVEPLVQTVDSSLSELLKKAAKARSAEEHQRILGEARDMVGQFTKFVESNRVIEHIDRNPFLPLAVGKTLTASLAAVAKTLR